MLISKAKTHVKVLNLILFNYITQSIRFQQFKFYFRFLSENVPSLQDNKINIIKFWLFFVGLFYNLAYKITIIIYG